MEKVIYTVKLGFTRITSSALVEKGRNCVTMLTGNAAFPTPQPKLVDLTTACDKLDSANQAYEFTRSRLDKDARDSSFLELKGLLKELGGYVQAQSTGDRELILSAGFEVEKGGSPVGPLPAPVDVRADVTLYPGRIELRWKGVRGRSVYRTEIREEGGTGGWTLLALTSKNRYTVEGLTSNTTYAFRVMALGAAGSSPASDIAVAKAA